MPDMDVSGAARELGVSERTVRRWLRDGRLSGYRVGGRIRIPARAVREARAPYGTAANDVTEPAPEEESLTEYLDAEARRRAKREAAARLMDEIAARSRLPSSADETAEGLIRALRGEQEAKWARLDADRRD